MDITSIIVIILGLCLFETINSFDNAIINAQVLSTMSKKSRKWFLLWGMLFAIFIVRGLLPWIIVWISTPSLTFWQALTATFSGSSAVKAAIESSSPILLTGAGTFLIFLFFHWLFMEHKSYGLPGEEFFRKKWVWFYTTVSIILASIVWLSIKINPLMAFGAVIGSTVFFVTNGFKQNAEESEANLMKKKMSDLSKIFYLEVIDTTFSIDGVLGAFAFTLSVPLIIIGNGLGALLVRHLTVSNIDRIKKYKYLKNGAMYSIFFLGIIMLFDSFSFNIPIWLSPVVTFVIIGYFYFKSIVDIRKHN